MSLEVARMKTRHLRPHLQRWIDQNVLYTYEGNQHTPIQELTKWAKTTDETIRKILVDPDFEAEFDVVDRIVCYTVGNEIYRQDAALAEDYWAVDLTIPARTPRNRCKRDGCTNTWPIKKEGKGGYNRKYCSDTCGSAHRNTIQGKTVKPDGPKRSLRIVQFRCGHEKDEHNTERYRKKYKGEWREYTRCIKCNRETVKRFRGTG